MRHRRERDQEGALRQTWRELRRMPMAWFIAGGAGLVLVLVVSFRVLPVLFDNSLEVGFSIGELLSTLLVTMVVGAIAGFMLYGVYWLHREFQPEAEDNPFTRTNASIASNVLRYTQETFTGGPEMRDLRLGVDFERNPNARRDYLIALCLHALAVLIWIGTCILLFGFLDIGRHRSITSLSDGEIATRVVVSGLLGLVSGIAWTIRAERHMKSGSIDRSHARLVDRVIQSSGGDQSALRAEMSDRRARLAESRYWAQFQQAVTRLSNVPLRTPGGPTVARRGALSAVRLLYLVAAADGELDTREAGVVVEMATRMSEGTLGPVEVLEEINRCHNQWFRGQLPDKLELISATSLMLRTESDRLQVIRAAIATASAAGQLCDAELAIIRQIGEVFAADRQQVEELIRAVSPFNESPPRVSNQDQPAESASPFVPVWDQPKYSSVWDDGGDDPAPASPPVESPSQPTPADHRTALADAWVMLGVPAVMAVEASLQPPSQTMAGAAQMLSIRALRRWPMDTSKHLHPMLKEVLQNRRLHILAARDFLMAQARERQELATNSSL